MTIRRIRGRGTFALESARAKYPPIITKSPCARFLIFITPQTRARPYALKANTAPTKIPSRITWTLMIGAHTKSNCRLSSMTISREVRKKGKE
jgi:hypothetical protein